MAPPLYALRALTRFRCIAERCEDTCCSGLTIPVDAAWIARVRTALAAEHGSVELPVVDEDGATWLRPTADGSCAFFDADRLCSLHRRFGEHLLPGVCASFPRVVAGPPERTVLTGSMACPELARQVLLEQDAMLLEPMTGAGPVESQGAKPLPTRWRDCATAIDQALWALLSRRDLTLRARFAILGQLADALDSATAQEDARGHEHPAASEVERVLAHFAQLEVHRAIVEQSSELALPREPTLALYVSLFQRRSADARGPRFDLLADSVLQSFATDRWTDPAAEFDARRAWVLQTHASAVALAFDHAALHHLTRHSWLEQGSLRAWTLRLAFRMGLVWTALLGHSAVGRRSTSAEEVSAALVEAFQLCARHLDQAPATLRILDDLTTAPAPVVQGRALIFTAYL